MITDLTAGRLKRIVLLAVAGIFIVWIIWSTRGALVPFLIGAIVAYLLAPVVDRIQHVFPQRGRIAAASRPIAILLTYLLAIGVLAAAGFYIVPPLIDQSTQFIEDLPQYWGEVQEQSNTWLALYRERVPESVRTQIEGNLDAIGAQLGTAVRAAMMVTFDAVGTVIGVAAGFALLPLWMFYVLKDQRKGLYWFYSLWPERWQDDVRAIVGMVDDVLAAYIRGQLFLGVVVGIVTGVAMWIIGINQSLVLGLVAGIFELIPVLGPWLAFVVAALVTLATEPDRILFVALAFLGIQQLENTFLVPKIQGDAVRIHPAAIMVLLVIGGSLWGVWGMIVVVPLAAILRDIFMYLYRSTDDP